MHLMGRKHWHNSLYIAIVKRCEYKKSKNKIEKSIMCYVVCAFIDM